MSYGPNIWWIFCTGPNVLQGTICRGYMIGKEIPLDSRRAFFCIIKYLKSHSNSQESTYVSKENPKWKIVDGHIPKSSSKRNSEVTFYGKEELVKERKKKKGEKGSIIPLSLCCFWFLLLCIWSLSKRDKIKTSEKVPNTWI